MKIAVTGASGFIGNVLCRRLLEEGHEVRAQYFSRKEALEGLEVEMVQGDVLDPAALEVLIRDCEVVFHCAAKISIAGDPDGMLHRVNVEGTQNVIEACFAVPKRPRLIFFSSIHAYATHTGSNIIDENTALAGSEASAYDYSKAISQQMVQDAHKKGLDTVVLNPTAVFGPWDFQPSLFGQMLLDLYHGKVPALVKGGYNFVDVRDVVDSSIQAMEKAPAGESYILAGHSLKIKELGALIGKATGKPMPRITLPIWVASLGLPFVKLWSKIRGSEPPYTRESLAVLSSKEAISGQKATEHLNHISRDTMDTLNGFYKWAGESKLL